MIRAEKSTYYFNDNGSFSSTVVDHQLSVHTIAFIISFFILPVIDYVYVYAMFTCVREEFANCTLGTCLIHRRPKDH